MSPLSARSRPHLLGLGGGLGHLHGSARDAELAGGGEGDGLGGEEGGEGELHGDDKLK